jgi:hypothetical protein
MTLMGNEPELGLGDSGEHVTQLQDRLRGLGLLDKHPDGTYDDATQTAVRQFQSDRGLDNDGSVTQETWQALDQHMLSNGLTYNPHAGPANQHWDVEQQAHEFESHEGESEEPGRAYEPEPAHAASAEHEIGMLSEDGHWKWNGSDWEAAQGPGQAAGAAEQGPAVIPHIDNIHPAIQGDERFSSFHEFLRENSNQ